MEFNSKIINVLPHGSGIDYDWTIERKAGKVICKNAYHRINNAGFYDGIFPFSVTFSHDNFIVKFHGLTSYAYKLVRWEGIRDYLEDTFALVFDDVKKVMEEETGTMWLDGSCGVYFYDKERPNMVYSYDRNTGEKYKARIILDKEEIKAEVGTECYDKYHHEYLLTDLKPLKHLPRIFMNYIRRKSKVVPHKYICSLGY